MVKIGKWYEVLSLFINIWWQIFMGKLLGMALTNEPIAHKESEHAKFDCFILAMHGAEGVKLF
jgi:hypothetical protein